MKPFLSSAVKHIGRINNRGLNGPATGPSNDVVLLMIGFGILNIIISEGTEGFNIV